MPLISLATLRNRWQLFVGAVVTVCIGVALVQASLLTLVAAATPNIPAGLSATEELLVRHGYAGAASLMGIMVGISVFVAVFIVGSTFAFTVAQRRRDFALLRLIGASRAQVRRLLIGEAVVLGTLGSTLGVLLGLLVVRYEERMLVELEFVPAGFTVDWRSWILAVSGGVGIGVAVLGSLASTRRAGRVRPLAALRETGTPDTVMTLPRWLVGLMALGGAVAMMIVGSAVGGAGALALSVSVCLVLTVALTALAPVVVPVVAGIVGLISRTALPRSRLGELVRANLHAGLRRSSSTAAPILMLIGLVVGLSGATDVMSAGSRAETMSTLDGDLVITSAQPIGDRLAEISGVAAVSEEVPIVVGVEDEPGAKSYEALIALAIDPATYPITHRLNDVDGQLEGLNHESVALSRGLASDLHVDPGEATTMSINGVERDVYVAATFPTTLSGPEVLLPVDVVPLDEPGRRYIVQVEAQAVIDLVASQAAALPTAEVATMDDWIGQSVAARERMSRNILVAIVGLAAVYTAVAMTNAVVVAAADRREEFAVARLTGLTRTQVIRAALWEALTTVTIGALLGGLVAGGTVLGVSAAVSDIVGTRVFAAPWALFGAVVASAAVIVAATSVLTTLSATRDAPIAVAAARQ